MNLIDDSIKPSLAELIQAEYLVSRIPATIWKPLPPDQKQEILNAFLKMAFERHSPIKFQAVIPLFFRRYYFLLWFGRDRRGKTVSDERVRTQMVPWPIRLVFYTFLIWFTASSFALLTFVSMYMLKSWLGIDIFPSHHLRDFVEMLMDWIT